MSAIFQSIQVRDEVSRMVDHSFGIVIRINETLEKQGKNQRDLANLLNKKEFEMSEWMQGAHDFRLSEIGLIESLLADRLIHSNM
jgi:hypothetical protein